MASRFHEKLNGWPAALLGMAVASVLAFYAYQYYGHLERERLTTLSELAVARERNYELLRVLSEKEGTIDAFQGTISDITNTVGTLEKLAKTDKQLLEKYSKVYFLNENYTPSGLVAIDRPYLNEGATNIEFLARAYPYLERLLRDARDDGVDLRVASAYRSFSTQASLKSAYTFTYGSGANKFSADQGYSEHQLGTTLDFTTTKLGANFSSFAQDKAYTWLLNNAHKYGFVLSYPEGNTYYKFEPWHWRFVGVDLARRLHDEGKHFYDLDQREIDEYLIKLFD